MECDKCKSENTEEVKRTQALHEEYYVEHVQWLYTIVTFKCKDCGHVFEEEFQGGIEMEDFKEAKVHYYENEIKHLEQKIHKYQKKVEFYSSKLNEAHDEMVEYLGVIQDIKKEDYTSELKMLKKKFAENKDNVLDNMKFLSDDSLSLARYEAYMRRLKGEQ